MKYFDEWLASGVHQLIEAGNMKPASRHLVFESILETWNRLEKKTDCGEDHLIHCFKEGQPCTNVLDVLKEQQNLLSNVDYLNSNPFEITL